MSKDQRSDDEYRAFWADVDAAAEQVAKWPEWKIDRVQAAKFAKSAGTKVEVSDEPANS